MKMGSPGAMQWNSAKCGICNNKLRKYVYKSSILLSSETEAVTRKGNN